MEYQDQAVREIGWEDEIENDGKDFITLPEGNYDFIVTKLERKRFDGSAKVPPCATAEITIEIESIGGSAVLTERMFMLTTFEWKLCQFFTCIGQRKKGEKLRPRWSEVVGSKGRVKVILNKYKDKDGNERTNNRVDRWLEPGEEQKAAAWTPGNF